MPASKFTPEVRDAITDLVSEGLTISDAASETEIPLPTVKTWLARGRREESGDYAEFVRAVDEARKAYDEREEPGSEEDLRLAVWRSAERGNVQAQKLYWEMIRGDEDAGQGTEEPLDGFDALDAGDELVRARARRKP